MVNLKEAIEYLIANGYIIARNNKYILMEQKLKKDLAPSKALTIVPSTAVVVAMKEDDWVERYKQFIIDARIPAKAEDTRGNYYALNKYSEDGMKAFRKAIEGGAQYELLVMSTRTYYKSGIKLKKAIGNYMHEGLWRSDYDGFTDAAETGTLTEHLKSELDDGQTNFTSF